MATQTIPVATITRSHSVPDRPCALRIVQRSKQRVQVRCLASHKDSKLLSMAVTERGRHCALQAQPSTGQQAQEHSKERPPPWSFGFQCNERYLQWDASAQRQLLKMHIAEKLHKVCCIGVSVYLMADQTCSLQLACQTYCVFTDGKHNVE